MLQTIFRPTMNARAIAAVLNGMTNEGYAEAIKPGAEFGVELRRSVVSTFVRERRIARKNAEQRARNAAQARTIRRKIAELERSEWAFLNSANLLTCRQYLRDIHDTGSELRELSALIGKNIETSAAFMETLLPRDLALDLLNVGSEATDQQYFREYNPTIREIISAGFADEASRGKQNRNVEAMQYCLHRVGRSAHVAQKIEASPEQFDALNQKIGAYRKKAKELFERLSDVAKDERAAKCPSLGQMEPLFARRAAVIEGAFQLWEEVQPVLVKGADGFSLEQKLTILHADPARVEGKDFPETTSLLELIAAGHVETGSEGEPAGPFMMLGMVSNTTEWRDQLELCLAALSRDGGRMTKAAGAVWGIEAMSVGSPLLH